MKKRIYLILPFIFLSILYANKHNYPNMSYFKGDYELIGKTLNSSKTYYGKVKIEIENNKFKMTRIIENKTNIIYGKFDTTSHLELSFLTFSFKENDINYVLNYEWYNDYNNYPILSGSISFADKKTNIYGMEFLRSIN